jgi:predicted GNAT family acetyltransferase
MIKRYKTLNNLFIEEIKSLIGQEKYEHTYLMNIISDTLDGQEICYEAWIIADNQESWIIGYWSVNYMLFGKNWTAKQLKLANEIIQPKRFKNYHFSGTRKLMEEFEMLNINIPFKDFKLRNFYMAISSISVESKIINARLAKNEDIDDLAQMRCDYYLYEYRGQYNKSLHEMTEKVKEEVQKREVYVATDQADFIVGFCTILDFETVGILFIKETHRNKGYGKSLSCFVTKKLLEHSDKCFLMTDINNGNSNKVAELIGYRKIYEYSDKIINNRG